MRERALLGGSHRKEPTFKGSSASKGQEETSPCILGYGIRVHTQCAAPNAALLFIAASSELTAALGRVVLEERGSEVGGRGVGENDYQA